MALPPTPDPSLGVFETMLVVDGEPVELEAHLERLRSSVEALYGAPLPDGAGHLVADAARGHAAGRVRLDARPADAGTGTGSAVDTAIDLAARASAIDPAIVFPGWEGGADLVARPVPGWNGAHKWADRRLLEALDAAAAPAAALLVDADGTVLETTRANVFVVGADGVLTTPPADGRLLPGVARRRAIEAARAAGIEVAEREPTVADLAAAGEAFATGSVRGVEPIRSIDGHPVGGPGGQVTEAVATALRERWVR